MDEVLMAGELQEVRLHNSHGKERQCSLYLSTVQQTSLNKITHIVHEQDLLENPQMNNSEFSIF
jgi:hypothetical protein